MSLFGTEKTSMRTPVGISEKGFIVIVAMAVVESVVLTAVMKNYSVEISGEVTECSLKGKMMLQPAV